MSKAKGDSHFLQDCGLPSGWVEIICLVCGGLSIGFVTAGAASLRSGEGFLYCNRRWSSDFSFMDCVL